MLTGDLTKVTELVIYRAHLWVSSLILNCFKVAVSEEIK